MRNLWFVVLALALTLVPVALADIAHDIAHEGEKKIILGREMQFISPDADVLWLVEQVALLEMHANTDSLTLEAVTKLLEKGGMLFGFAEKVDERIDKTVDFADRYIEALDPLYGTWSTEELTYLIKKKRECYPLENRRSSFWAGLSYFHGGYLEGRIKFHKAVIKTLEAGGFNDYKTRLGIVHGYKTVITRHTKKDVPFYLRELRNLEEELEGYEVPSIHSLKYRISQVRKHLVCLSSGGDR